MSDPTRFAFIERGEFFALLDGLSSILEIGPFANPVVTGSHVKYFDVLSTEGLRARARTCGLDPEKCPPIDYVSATGDLAIVNETFEAVVSSHNIEHQPDLVRHLLEVSHLLNKGCRYFLAIPDKRYCFDHFLPESTIAEVLDAHARDARFHDLANLIDHLALTTHNDPGRHWKGDHGEPAYRSNIDRIRQALNIYEANRGRYFDTHAWQFVPTSFRDLVETLHAVRLSALRVERVYETRRGAIEFYAVLQKVDDEIEPIGKLPADFDPDSYLLANPDVARGGGDPREHYMAYGRFEGRKLRP